MPKVELNGETVLEFEFKKLSNDDLVRFEEESKVFNMSDEDLKKESVVVNSFASERLGASLEVVDIAVSDGKDKPWRLLDVQGQMENFKRLPLSYLIGDKSFSRVMIITRRVSNLLIDKVKEGASSVIYSRTFPFFDNILKFPALSGILASNKVYLDEPYDIVVKGVKMKFVDDEYTASRILSKLEEYASAQSI